MSDFYFESETARQGERASLPIVAPSSHHTQGPVVDFSTATIEEVETALERLQLPDHAADWWKASMKARPPVSSSQENPE